MLQRMFVWFSELNLAQKVLAVLFAGLFLFSAFYLVTTSILYLGEAGDRADYPLEEGAAPNNASPGSSASAEATVPNNRLSITGARWEGEKAVVEGTWKGEVSSVHCDLLEGGTSGKPFTQEFVAAEGNGGGEPLARVASYGVVCSARFSGGWSVNDVAPVEATPPG